MIFTVGHSTHSQEAFWKIIKGKISTLIDVRSHPGSRWPQFQKENLEKWIPEMGIRYEWEPRMGGWNKEHVGFAEEMKQYNVNVLAYSGKKFPKHQIAQKTLPRSANEFQQEYLPNIKPFWNNRGLYEYSFYMMIDEFIQGANALIERGKTEDVAIMCSECTSWRCHRSMISDYIAFKGHDVQHLMPHMRQKNKIKYVDGVKVTHHSKILGNRLDRYENVIIDRWRNHV